MCFSASASFISGAALTTVGLITISKVKKKREIAFGAIPLMFGIQQLIEGIVWITLGNNPLNTLAARGYLMFSHVIWPVFVPYAILLMEPNKSKKKILKFLLLVGALISLYFLIFVLTSPVTCDVVGSSLQYHIQHPQGKFGVYLYIIATCISCLISSHRIVRLFGLTLVATLIASYIWYAQTSVSVWCFFAAILSGIVYFNFVPSTKVPKKG